MTTPEELNAVLRAFQQSRTVLTALELDLFTHLQGGGTAADVARAAGTDERATGMLLNALASLGVVRLRGGGYENTGLSRTFVEGEPGQAREAALHLAFLWRRWSTLTECVRAGTRRPDLWGDADDELRTRSFIAAMNRNAAERVPHVVAALKPWGVRRVLDLGGGSGIYSIGLAQADPRLSAEVLDLPAVVPLAQAYVRAAGVGDRVSVRPGDMIRDDYGRGYDLVLISAICHMFGPAENRRLLGKAREALEPGGHVVIQDFLLDPDRAGPPQAALFALNMLVATEAGNTYTLSDYQGWLGDAGFSGIRRIELPGPADLVVGEAV